jgi:hypothetical protein
MSEDHVPSILALVFLLEDLLNGRRFSCLVSALFDASLYLFLLLIVHILRIPSHSFDLLYCLHSVFCYGLWSTNSYRSIEHRLGTESHLVEIPFVVVV